MPLIIQFNKRDMKDVRTDEELGKLASQGKEPVYLAVATRGDGVVESFMGLLKLTWDALDSQHRLAEKFGLDADEFLTEVARQLGMGEPSLHEIFDAAVGGKQKVLNPGVSK